MLNELRAARMTAGLSQSELAYLARVSQSAFSRMEGGELSDVGVVRLSENASLLGLDLVLSLHVSGDGVRDRAQLKIGARLEAMLSSKWRTMDETLLPTRGDMRAWDKTLRLLDSRPRHLVGVDIESRVRDVQALVRRTRLRERDGQVDAILIVLADTGHNRTFIDELRVALGQDYRTQQSDIVRALHSGLPLPGSGVILV